MVWLVLFAFTATMTSASSCIFVTDSGPAYKRNGKHRHRHCHVKAKRVKKRNHAKKGVVDNRKRKHKRHKKCHSHWHRRGHH